MITKFKIFEATLNDEEEEIRQMEEELKKMHPSFLDNLLNTDFLFII
jgi:bacterioferritin (cytochrome b1)